MRRSSTSTLGLSLLLLLLAAASARAADGQPLLRFPDIHSATVVFVHGEDIWKAPAGGGTAIRLTFHAGQERYPRFSPDGRHIAFSGEYDGNTDVYVMNTEGGGITRVTYHPAGDEVVGWSPDGRKILFRSARGPFSRQDQLYLIAPDGTGLERLPLHEAATGSFSPDGKQIAYNRVRREHRTWKRYVGGLSQDVYICDLASLDDRKVTEFRGTDRTPMWIGNSIYFVSDRERTLNIFGYDIKTGAIRQITHHADYDVRRASSDDRHIVYEVGGVIWMLDPQTGKTAPIRITVASDDPETRPYWRDVSGQITQIACSPTGKRALVVARGELFTVPRHDGPTRNLTRSSGAHDKDAAWSPDGTKIAYLSDAGGEYAIHLIDPEGTTTAVQLTHHQDGYRHTLRWSPDGKKIAFADQTLSFYILDVATREITRAARSPAEPTDIGIDLKPIHDYTWSPDSRFMAYTMIDEDLVSRVYVYSLEKKRSWRVSGDLFNDFGPAFSRDGRYLFFISNRRFDPTYCDFEWEMVYKKVAGIYCVTLARDGKPLMPLRSDEEGGPARDTNDGDHAAEAEQASGNLTIDFDGIARRIEALPVPRGNYRRLAAGRGQLYFLDTGEGDFNRFEFRAPGPRKLESFSFEDREVRTVAEGVTDYALSADGSTILYRQGGKLAMIDARGAAAKPDQLDLSGLEMWLDPRREWCQIFNEAWRMERDFYYEPGMHGIDWPAMKVKYGRLVPFASCRQDLRFLIGELIGELNTSHTYVYGGTAHQHPESVSVGMLGADWTADASSRRYRIAKIYDIPDWTREVRPPLARPGIEVGEGDYLLRLDGQEVTTDKNIYSYFQGLAGKQVTLLVNDRPSLEGARKVRVKPLSSENVLRYRAWVEHNREVVDRESNGLIGYLHLPDTYLGSSREFPKYFYSQTRKKGLLIDGRVNGGGLDPDIFLQRLGKNLLAYWTRRYSMRQTTPAVVTRAHLALITNRQAGSGGDMLPMEFRQKKLGPIIGTRTWGGLVGVSMFITLVDGGGLTAPDYRIYDPEGHWVVENTGITPDIEVDLTPAEMARGYDAQLMRGIEVLMKKIAEDPREPPRHDPFPVDR